MPDTPPPSSAEGLRAQALAAMQAAGLPFEILELNAGWRRHPQQDALWYIADAGTGRTAHPVLPDQPTAGGAAMSRAERLGILLQDAPLKREEAQRVAGLAQDHYQHRMGCGKTSNCCSAAAGPWCPAGVRLRDLYYSAAAEIR